MTTTNGYHLCPDGLKKCTEYDKWEELWARHGSISNLWQISSNLATAWQDYQEHIAACEKCEGGELDY